MAAWLSNIAARLVSRANAAPAIEPAVPRDAAALSALHRASFHRGWSAGEFEQMLSERNTLAHRLRLGGQVAGFIVSRIAADEAEILSVAVAAKYRGRGLSRELLRTHLGYLAGYGLKTVFLEVEENNRPARALYERAGFQTVGRRERYYKDAGGEQLNALVMKRDLS
ncbi:ribosomal protein S18-alanine N-acetyltransferase [Afipia sp. TerB]